MSGRRDSRTARTSISETDRATYRDDSRDPRLQRTSPGPSQESLVNRMTDKDSEKERSGPSRRNPTTARRTTSAVDKDKSRSGLKEIQDEQNRPFCAPRKRVMSPPLHRVASPQSTISTAAAEITGSAFPAPLENTRMLVFAESLDDPIICNMPLDGTGKICTHVVLGVWLLLCDALMGRSIGRGSGNFI